MKPYGLQSLEWRLRRLVCEGCFAVGVEPVAKGVICPVCQADLCLGCMAKHQEREHQPSNASS